MEKFGSIYYTGSVLIRHLCEHDPDILFTSAFEMADLYRFVFMGLAKKHSFLTASIFRRSID